MANGAMQMRLGIHVCVYSDEKEKVGQEHGSPLQRELCVTRANSTGKLGSFLMNASIYYDCVLLFLGF